MSFNRNDKTADSLNISLAKTFQSNINHVGKAGYSTDDDYKASVSLESFALADTNSETYLQTDSSYRSHREKLEQVINAKDPSYCASLTEAQKKAGTIISMAASNLKGYARAAYGNEATAISLEGKFDTIPWDGVEEKLHPSLESFDTLPLDNFAGHSIQYNIQAAKQGPLAEMFFKTNTISPDMGGIDISIRNINVFNHYIHAPTGAPADFKKRRLLDATIDRGILADESTDVVPEVLPDDANEEYFVSPSQVATKTVKVGGQDVPTRPLVFGKRFNLIGISQNHRIQRVGAADNTTSLDKLIGLKRLYAQLADGDVISFDVQDTPGSYFVKGPEGRANNLVMVYYPRGIQLTYEIKTHQGTAVEAGTVLAEIVTKKLVVSLSLSVTGDMDREIANMTINSGAITVDSIYNAETKVEISDKDADYISIKNAIETNLKLIGWDVFARFTNTNREERGLQLDITPWSERYPINLGAPISIPTPLMEKEDSGAINALITAVRLRNDNNAITKLISYMDRHVTFFTDNYSSEDQKTFQMEGIARWLIHPWFDDDVLILPTSVNSVTTADRLKNISETIVNTLRSKIYNAYRDTNIGAVYDAYTGYTGQKLKIILGTDTVLARFIFTESDTRTFGDQLPHQIETTQDKRMYGYIYYTFSADQEGIYPFNFGSHLFIPELISNVRVVRNGKFFEEAMVQPRQRHIVHLPILGRLKVEGLEDILTQQTIFQVNDTSNA